MKQINMLCLTKNFTNITGFVKTIREYQHCPIKMHNWNHYSKSCDRDAIEWKAGDIFFYFSVWPIQQASVILLLLGKSDSSFDVVCTVHHIAMS